MIIGIHGKARSGKTTTAGIITQFTSMQSYAFADPIKDMLTSVGVDCSDDMKDVVHPVFKKTPRQLMNSLGTDWGRKMNHDDVWIDHLYERATGQQHFSVSDVRFENEAQSIRDRDGVILHIVGHGGIAGNYQSEIGIVCKPGDYILNNDGVESNLYVKVYDFLKSLDFHAQ